MIPLEMSARMVMDVMAFSLIGVTMICILAIGLAIHWMKQCRDAEDYIDELRQRLRPYEQPGRGPVIIPDVEVYDERTGKYEPLRAYEVRG